MVAGWCLELEQLVMVTLPDFLVVQSVCPAWAWASVVVRMIRLRIYASLSGVSSSSSLSVSSAVSSLSITNTGAPPVRAAQSA